mmetsp:Transcript_39893/g.85465  ORF Transcript_39893/g.85465 Transcript_39893/m.85465 type:complete len:159 (-) Transcript_39893:81-557(-)
MTLPGSAWPSLPTASKRASKQASKQVAAAMAVAAAAAAAVATTAVTLDIAGAVAEAASEAVTGASAVATAVFVIVAAAIVADDCCIVLETGAVVDAVAGLAVTVTVAIPFVGTEIDVALLVGLQEKECCCCRLLKPAPALTLRLDEAGAGARPTDGCC